MRLRLFLWRSRRPQNSADHRRCSAYPKLQGTAWASHGILGRLRQMKPVWRPRGWTVHRPELLTPQSYGERAVGGLMELARIRAKRRAGVETRRERPRRRGAGSSSMVRGGRLRVRWTDRQHLSSGPAAIPIWRQSRRRPSRHRAGSTAPGVMAAGGRAHQTISATDRAPHRDRRVDQRGGLAVLPGDGRLGRLRRGVRPRWRSGDRDNNAPD
jgi:hypothetical protein